MKKIDCLKQYLIRCCYWYYVKDNPLISDRIFDMLFSDMKRRESDRLLSEGVFPDEDSPTQIIWGDLEEQYTEDWMKTRDDMEACTE